MANKRQIKRLKRLIHFLEEELHPKKFDLEAWLSPIEDKMEYPLGITLDPYAMAKHPSEFGTCNTAGCVVGWFPHLFPKMSKWVYDKRWREWSVVGGKLIIDIDNDNDDKLQEDLFTDVTGIKKSANIIYIIDRYRNYRSDNPTPKVVAKRIREVAAREGIDLS